MLALLGVSKRVAARLLAPYPIAKWVACLTAIDPKYVFFTFIEERLDKGKIVHGNTSQFIAGRGCDDVTALAAAIRHIFFHGELTPNAGGVAPATVCQVCDYLIQVLFGVMNREIGPRLAPFDRPRPEPAIDDEIPF